MTSPDRPIRTLIVDDEPLARRSLVVMLAGDPAIQIAGECRNGREALARLSEDLLDLVLLDVQMPGLDGFGALRAIAAPHLPLTVFVTAYDHYAVRAFAACAIDYLLKPIDDARFQIALERGAVQRVYLEISTSRAEAASSERYERALHATKRQARQRLEGGGFLRSGGRLFDQWIDRSRSDLALLTDRKSVV